MPVIFQDNIGKIVTIDDPTVSAFLRPLVTMKNVDEIVSVQTTRSLITHVTVSQKGNYQFLHTLGSDIYIYVFGDQVGQLVLSGLSFPRACDGGTKHGMEEMLRWYRDHKVAARSSPMTIAIGSEALTGYVVGMDQRVLDPMTRVAQFDLTLFVIPDKPAPITTGDSTGQLNLLGAGTAGGLA